MWRVNKLSPVEGWTQKTKPFKNHQRIDTEIKKIFLTDTGKDNFSRYQSIFEYLIFGFINYRSPLGAFVYYPGAGGHSGRKIDGLEGFSRFLPLAASWLGAGNPRELSIYGNTIDLIELLHQGIVAGTYKDGEEYWGDIKDRDQRIVEAADIALSLWLCKEQLWGSFSGQEKVQICNWLLQTKDRDVFSKVGCNWELFPILILMILKDLGFCGTETSKIVAKRFHYYLRNYLGSGWFYDTSEGVDYYNAWAIHYSLFWMNQIDPSFEGNFIIDCHLKFLEFYKYFFSKHGFPLMGRSACYRLAAPGPLVSGSLLVPDIIPIGLAYRALDLTWKFFIENGSLRFGAITQGYCCQNLSILDKYSGPGSCLWSLRSLVIALYVSKFQDFWAAPLEKLPIEVQDFSIKVPNINWLLEGKRSNQEIKLILLQNQENNPHDLIQYGVLNRTMEFIFRRPFRPNNSQFLYYRKSYSNLSPIVHC